MNDNELREILRGLNFPEHLFPTIYDIVDVTAAPVYDAPWWWRHGIDPWPWPDGKFVMGPFMLQLTYPTRDHVLTLDGWSLMSVSANQDRTVAVWRDDF